jgi:hypothetical protein
MAVRLFGANRRESKQHHCCSSTSLPFFSMAPDTSGNLLVPFDALPFLLPDVVDFAPPSTHQVAANLNECAATIARRPVVPSDVE